MASHLPVSVPAGGTFLKVGPFQDSILPILPFDGQHGFLEAPLLPGISGLFLPLFPQGFVVCEKVKLLIDRFICPLITFRKDMV